MKITEILLILLLLVSLAQISQGQDLQRDKIARLERELREESDPELRFAIREEIESLQEEMRVVREIKDLDFDRRLDYIRSGLIADDEQSMVAMAHTKVDKALFAFLQTDFMKKYKDLQIEAESLAGAFKTSASQFTPDEVAKVKLAYTKISEEFNRFILDLKGDFMDSKKLRLIRSNSDMYTNSLQFKINELQRSYSENFERVVAEVTGSDTYAAIPIAAIFSLIKLAKDFTDYLIRASYEARRVKEEHLNIYLVEPYSFKPWIDIEILEAGVFEYEEYDQISDQDPLVDDMNPFEDDDEQGSPLKKTSQKKDN